MKLLQTGVVTPFLPLGLWMSAIFLYGVLLNKNNFVITLYSLPRLLRVCRGPLNLAGKFLRPRVHAKINDKRHDAVLLALLDRPGTLAVLWLMVNRKLGALARM